MPNKRALIVDDSTTAQYRLKKMLRPFSLDTDSVDSGEAALRYLATNIPDVIFMDHLMPGMDGFRALQIIKSHPETAMIPVIMYTSKSGDVYTGQARALGALDVVSKDSINAADLSNVMRAIHIYRTDETPEERAEKTEEVQTTSKAASKIVDVTNHKIERRASNNTNAEQARNLELRLSHMEHTLEDSRRFITERVVRELQSLKQNLKEEFIEIAEHSHISPESIEQLKKSESFGWSLVNKLILIAPLFFIAFYLFQMNDALTEGQAQQQKLSAQISELANKEATVVPVVAAAPIPTNTPAQPEITETKETSKHIDKTYLNDIAWTFNQTASLPFNQGNVDAKVIIRLYELLNRLINSGFKGRAWINIYVGNFCLATDNVGQAQLVSDGQPMGNCMLSSEVYGMDRLMEQYTRDVESALRGLDQRNEKNIHVVINAMSEPDDYPERKPVLSAKSWNTIAQNHNRMELSLEPKLADAPQTTQAPQASQATH